MKYIVVHSGSRDQYKLAQSLFNNDKLGYLVTDDIFFRRKYRNLFPRKLVKISYIGLFFRIILFFFKKWDGLHLYKDYYLGRTAGKLSQIKNMSLFALNGYAIHAYKFTHVSPKVVFQFHPHAISNKKIFMDEISKHPELAESFKFEKEVKISEGKLNDSIDEINQTDYYVTASSFTKQTLVENGADENHIFIAPYGVDTSSYPFCERSTPKIVNFVFVGSYTERKGLYYLLNAAKQLQDEGFDFVLNMTGRANFNPDAIRKYDIKNLKLNYNLNHDELIKLLHDSDVFVFPSLCEGFAFVIIEAMATGLPVITTTHTFGRDIISNYKEGFTIEPSSVDEIYRYMKYFILNPNKCVEMGKMAYSKSKTITWDNFECQIMNAINSIESDFFDRSKDSNKPC
jgi:glycosyltransferase involved in cell wall biosynthesis